MAFGSARLARSPGSSTVEYPAVGGFAFTVTTADLISVLQHLVLALIG